MSTAGIDAIADRIAVAAHAGQVDKAGADYITHPRRVAERVVPSTPETRAAALLHDVLEDTEVSVEDLAAQGIPVEVVRALKLLDRGRSPSPERYYAAIRGNAIALAVKLADIADNSDPARLALLDEQTQPRLRRKYSKALTALLGSDA
jgi:(p)ppGpp synthase/HD superfamily hydrolase